jgi:hypothetical protein
MIAPVVIILRLMSLLSSSSGALAFTKSRTDSTDSTCGTAREGRSTTTSTLLFRSMAAARTSSGSPENINAATAAAATTVDYEGLERLGYTKGLCEALVASNHHVVAKRFWILDNSGVHGRYRCDAIGCRQEGTSATTTIGIVHAAMARTARHRPTSHSTRGPVARFYVVPVAQQSGGSVAVGRRPVQCGGKRQRQQIQAVLVVSKKK